jgi:hypothetical protein
MANLEYKPPIDLMVRYDKNEGSLDLTKTPLLISSKQAATESLRE